MHLLSNRKNETTENQNSFTRLLFIMENFTKKRRKKLTENGTVTKLFIYLTSRSRRTVVTVL